jgi:PKD repeat protein
MKKLFIFMIGIFVVINIVLGSIAGLTSVASSDEDTDTSRAARIEQKSPDEYDPSNVYYLCSPTTRTTVHFLKGVPFISDGSDADLNKVDMVNGKIYPFSWPAMGQKAAKLKINESFTGQPFISLVINSLEDASKTIVVTLGIDTNNKYDEHIPTSLEHRCEFPPYQTTGDLSDGTMEEELYEAYGTWQGGRPPSVIEKGRVILEVTMTSPNGNPAVLYCGFNFKSSWIAAPYMHTDLVPKAKINETYRDQGFPPDDKIMVGDRIMFDGSDSFDPNDDLNGNEKIDAYEIDRLKYRWTWGDGTVTNFDYGNKRAYHTYSANSIPLTSEYRDFQVNLTVLDEQGHSDFNATKVRIYRGNHSPEILSLKINDRDQLGKFPKEVTSILDPRIDVYFSCYAIDKDNDEVKYYWDFDNDGEFDEIDRGGPAGSVVTYQFNNILFAEGRHKIKVVVSDGTLVENATGICFINLKKNVFPIAQIQAKREFDPIFYENTVTVKINQLITFYANQSYDPDNLIGFDTDNDNETDYQLKYRWNFNILDPSATSGWITQDFYEYTYLSAGSYKYMVTLDVDDGVNVTTSDIFVVNVNVRPIAKIIVDPRSYDAQGNLVLGELIYFNGTPSYDPNKDPLKNYTWQIGTGDNAIKKYGGKIIHKFQEPGKHLVSLTVYDGEFWSTQYQINVEIPDPPKPPIPKYKASPLEIFAKKRVYFDASNTTDPDSDDKDLKFIWYFGDGTSYISRENITSHKYNNPGQYKVILVVEDETGATGNISNILITVKNNPPTAVIKKINPKDINEKVQISGSDSSDKDGKILTYIWTFGDGSDEQKTNESQITHTWKRSGSYTIELTVQDDSGGTDTTQFQIQIEDPDSGGGMFSEDQSAMLLAGGIITAIIVVVIIIVVIVIIRSKESI